MATLYDRVKVSTSTTGNGPMTLGVADTGFRDFGVVTDGATVPYVIEDGTSWEIGTGVWTQATNVLTRVVGVSSNGSTPISLSGSAKVFISATADTLAEFLTPALANQPNGYAALNGSGVLDVNAVIPAGELSVSQVYGLQAALDNTVAPDALNAKLDVSLANQPNGYAGLNGSGVLDVNAVIPAGELSISQVYGLQTALDNTAAPNHSHAISDTTGLQDALDAKLDLSLANQPNGYAGLNASGALDVNAVIPAGELTISQVYGLQTALDNTATPDHNHDAVYAPIAAAVPTGGTTGQILAKASGTDHDTSWIDAPSGGGGGGSLTTATSKMTSDTSISDGVFGTLTSVSLEAGTWMVMAHANYGQGTTSTCRPTFKLHSGGTCYAAVSETVSTSNAPIYRSICVSAIVTVASTTTVTWSAAAQNFGATVYANPMSNGSGLSGATMINAIKVG